MQVVREVHAPWRFGGARSCHRVDDDRRLLALEFVYRAHSSAGREPARKQRRMGVVGRNDDDVLRLERRLSRGERLFGSLPIYPDNSSAFRPADQPSRLGHRCTLLADRHED